MYALTIDTITYTRNCQDGTGKYSQGGYYFWHSTAAYFWHRVKIDQSSEVTLLTLDFILYTTFAQ